MHSFLKKTVISKNYKHVIMKKIFTLCCAAILSSAISAQTVKLYKGKTQFAAYSSAQVDGVEFDKEHASAKLYKGDILVKEYGNATVDSVVFGKEYVPANLNVTVSDFDDATGSAKAKNLRLNASSASTPIKEKWIAGDIIKIWIDECTSEYYANPNYILKFDGESWKMDNTAGETTECAPVANGKFKCVYDGDVKMVATADYTYNEKYGAMSATISGWKYITEVAFVLKGLSVSDADDAAKYNFSCPNLTPITGYTVTTDGIEAVKGEKGAAANGIYNADGLAFVFATTDYTASSYDFKLNSMDEGTQELSKTSTLSEVANHAKLKRVNLTYSQFGHAYVEIAGIRWATRNLGATTTAGSPATCYGDYYAWGATEPWYQTFDYETGKITEWKSNYSGGYTESNTPYYDTTSGGYTKYIEKTKDSPYSTWSDDKFDNLINLEKSEQSTADDAATYNWGTDWHTPLKAEMMSLFYACVTYDNGTPVIKGKGSKSTTEKGVYWCPDYDGVSGYLFHTGSSKVFIPAAGRIVFNDGTCENTDMSEFGCYWFATRVTADVASAADVKGYNVNTQAWSVGFTGDNEEETLDIEYIDANFNMFRCEGFSIRPVSSVSYDISAATVTGIENGGSYSSGYNPSTAVTVTASDGTQLIEDSHYSIVITDSAGNSVAAPLTTAGTYTVTITGYQGSTNSQSFSITVTE